MSTNNDKPENYGKPWSRDELIVAFELYCRIPFKKTKANNPAIIKLAEMLRRSPAGIARKLGNFGAFDPSLLKLSISGLTHSSKLDREIWDEFHADWNSLTLEAHKLRKSLKNESVKGIDPIIPTGPSEKVQLVKQRVHQTFFRQAILSSYEERCCITGLKIVDCLIASHIVPWAEDERYRAEPSNGLCLSATFDRLFDRGLISVSKNLTVIVCDKLIHHGAKETHDLISHYHNKPIIKPRRFQPAPEHLAWHRDNIFIDR